MRRSLTVAATLLAASAVYANEHEDKNTSQTSTPGTQQQQPADQAGTANNQQQQQQSALGAPGAQQSGKYGEKEHGDKAHAFLKKAAQGGKMEVKMGQLAQQKGQSQEVKDLGAALVRDHTAANRKLQQLAQKQNVQVTADLDPKHQKHVDMLQSKSGAEFDKAFVTHALKDHKKDIAEFEKCSKDVTDAELKAFVDQTLPVLRNHYQMAQNAARAVGVDETSIAADFESDDDSATGAPAAGQTGTKQTPGQDRDQNRDNLNRQNNNQLNTPPENRPQSNVEIERFDGAVQTDSSLTTSQNTPSATPTITTIDPAIDADADVDIDRTDDGFAARTDVDVDADNDEKLFQKGDGKILGLPTDKNDGKLLGILPAPGGKEDNDVDVDADVDVETDTGSPGTSVSGRASSTDKRTDDNP